MPFLATVPSSKLMKVMEKDLVWGALGLDSLLYDAEGSIDQEVVARMPKGRKEAVLKHQRMIKKPTYGAIMQRYQSIPHKPKVMLKSRLDRLADPVLGRLTQAERRKYEQYVEQHSPSISPMRQQQGPEVHSDEKDYDQDVFSLTAAAHSPMRAKQLFKPSAAAVNGFFMTEPEDRSPTKPTNPMAGNVRHARHGFASAFRNQVKQAHKLSKLAEPLQINEERRYATNRRHGPGQKPVKVSSRVLKDPLVDRLKKVKSSGYGHAHGYSPGKKGSLALPLLKEKRKVRASKSTPLFPVKAKRTQDPVRRPMRSESVPQVEPPIPAVVVHREEVPEVYGKRRGAAQSVAALYHNFNVPDPISKYRNIAEADAPATSVPVSLPNQKAAVPTQRKGSGSGPSTTMEPAAAPAAKGAVPRRVSREKPKSSLVIAAADTLTVEDMHQRGRASPRKPPVPSKSSSGSSVQRSPSGSKSREKTSPTKVQAAPSSSSAALPAGLSNLKMVRPFEQTDSGLMVEVDAPTSKPPTAPPAPVAPTEVVADAPPSPSYDLQATMQRLRKYDRRASGGSASGSSKDLKVDNASLYTKGDVEATFAKHALKLGSTITNAETVLQQYTDFKNGLE